MFSPISTLYTDLRVEFFIRVTVDILLMALGLFFTVRLYKKGKLDKTQTVACGVLVVWGSFVLLLTVIGRRSHPDVVFVHNFELFSSYRQIIDERHTSLLISVIENILMFTPIGFTLSVVFRNKHRFIIPLAICFLLSLFIETCQLILNAGMFELDDLFNNTLGGLIGIIICMTISLIYRTIRKHHRKEDILASKDHR